MHGGLTQLRTKVLKLTEVSMRDLQKAGAFWTSDSLLEPEDG